MKKYGSADLRNPHPLNDLTSFQTEMLFFIVKISLTCTRGNSSLAFLTILNIPQEIDSLVTFVFFNLPKLSINIPHIPLYKKNIISPDFRIDDILFYLITSITTLELVHDKKKKRGNRIEEEEKN